MSTAQTAQAAIDFKPIGQTLPQKPERERIRRGGYESRYNEALDYLRAELKNGQSAALQSGEIANTFKITSSFLTLCVAMKAIQDVGYQKGKGRMFRATPLLSQIDGVQLRNFRLKNFPNPESAPAVPQHLLEKTPEQRQALVNAMNTMAVKIKPGSLFLVGQVQGTTFTADLHDQFASAEQAEDFIRDYSLESGQKYAIVQVTSVVESRMTLLPSTL
ncbi:MULTISPECIES: hypothetical protein [unclassified Spirosoma]|uniref:hypothetical protein n=1 Tax=unclassified Spirosoma TaxID=2621999 RepID=UPI00096483D9|nr:MULTISPECIES: hypothetical protein [unclassified Spirosoma]MBN8824424.1 hypothetical protein [Spirosoma sp.]OJW70113.1 MAG: hypothetical protein BGO59_25910 [Spirosoma sp. 48-14]